MHNNFYEHIFQKLQKAELPPDPSAWLEMEKLLEKEKPKRRPFGWLWIAALIGITALSGGGFWYFNTQGKNSGIEGQNLILEKQAEQTTAHVLKKTKEENGTIVSEGREEVSAEKLTSKQKAFSTNQNPLSVKDSKFSKQYATSSTSQNVIVAGKSKRISELQNFKSNVLNPAKYSGSGKQENIQAPNIFQSVAVVDKTTETNSIEKESIFNSELEEKANNSLSNPEMKETVAEVSSEVKEQTELKEDKPVQPNAVDQKENFKSKKKVSFGLGIYSNLQASILGNTLHNRPSHQSGLAFSLFIKKIAALNIGLGIGMTQYSQNKLSGPKANNTIAGFHSQIQEISIPLSLTLYPYQSNKINFGITLGVGNHIKMRENIRLVYMDEKESTSTLLNNNFSDNQQEVLVASKNGDFKLEDMALGGTGRYYISGFAALRTEVKLFKNLWFNVELNSSIKPKPGTQAKPLMGVGGGLGLGYRF